MSPVQTINNTNSDIEEQKYHPHRKKQITYQNRNHNKSSITNNSNSIHNNIPSPNQHNIQPTNRTGKNTTNIRKYAHQARNNKTKINDKKKRTDHDIVPKNNSLTESIKNKKKFCRYSE